MAKLFTYCIPGDDGAAPNPYGGICTLNICKPVVRRIAQVGDWVVGTGSTQYGFQNKIVYAMEVTQKLTMKDYYSLCKTTKELKIKIPDWDSKIYRERVGDSIYDFSTENPILLESVHRFENMKTDLGGKFTLLSDHFYYFGSQPEALPDHLLPIVKQGQGHKSTSNYPYLHHFIDWIVTKEQAKNTIFAIPKEESRNPNPESCRATCSARDMHNDILDESIGDEI